MNKTSPFSFKLKVQSSALAFHRLRVVNVAMHDNSFILKCSRIQFAAFIFECYSVLLHINENVACHIRVLKKKL